MKSVLELRQSYCHYGRLNTILSDKMDDISPNFHIPAKLTTDEFVAETDHLAKNRAIKAKITDSHHVFYK